MKIDFSLPDPILALIERLEQNGEEAYLVGGSLRDLLLGIPPHDFDLTTSALPEKTVAVFSDHRVIETGLKHGTVTVLVDGEPIEITTFRIDGTYTDARHPDRVTFTNRITEDLARRDFTVNAMAYHPTRGLIDPFGGKDDLARKILRAVGDPKRRFEEDALRIMRAFRFSAQLDFEIEAETLTGAKESKFGLTNIARERIASEFLRLLTSKNPAHALRSMIDCEILPFVVGSYVPSDTVLNRIAEMPQDEIARLGFFFSDFSTFSTLAEGSDNRREALSHLLKSLKLSNKQVSGTCAVVSASQTAVTTPADARRLIAACGVYAPLAIRASVLLGINSPDAIAWIEQNQAPCTIADLAVTGKDLLALGIEPRRIGTILEKLLRAVLEEPSNNEKNTLLALIKTWENPKVS